MKPIYLICLLTCSALMTVCSVSNTTSSTSGSEGDQGVAPLKVEGRYMINEEGKRVWLVGFQVPWIFLREGRTVEKHREFVQKIGERVTDFYDAGFSNWFTAEDVKQIAEMGANCIRLTTVFWTYEEEPYKYSDASFRRLDRVIEECGKRGVYVVLSCNSAPGGQNPAGHGGAGGRNEYWMVDEYQKRYVSMWKEIAGHYKNSTAIAGYDILNEPAPPDDASLARAYRDIVNAIRSTGDRHIIFLQYPLKAGADVPIIEGENIAYSFHLYAPTEFTHQKMPGTIYPGNVRGRKFNRDNLERLVRRRYADKAQRNGLCLWVGEFGAVDSAPGDSELRWIEDCLMIWEKLEIGWSYYMYKGGKPGKSFAVHKPPKDPNDLLPIESIKEGKIDETVFGVLKTENFITNGPLVDLLKRYMGKR